MRYPVRHFASEEKFMVGKKEYFYVGTAFTATRPLLFIFLASLLVPIIAALFGGWGWLFLYTFNWIPITISFVGLQDAGFVGSYRTQDRAFAAATEFANQCEIGDRMVEDV